MRLKLSSLAGALALVICTTAGAQDITKKPVTGADRKKATAPAAAKPPATTEPTTSTDSAGSPPLVTSPTPVQPTTAAPATTADEPAAPQSTAPGQTGTTPGQTQASPGEASEITPAETGTTPSGQSVPSGQASAPQVTAATAADVKAGVSVFDQKGGVVGKVDSVSGKTAVVSTGKVKASVPISSFAKGDKGLVISMSKAEIDAQAKAATTTTTKTAPPKKPK